MKNPAATKPWAVTPEKVERAINKVVEVCSPFKLILFGSYVRGQTDMNSDLDMLVITREELSNPRKESVRIRRALRGISMPMDILVVSQARWQQLKDVPGTVYREAQEYGRVVYES